MMRLAVRFAYLGAGFSGSQVQPGARTVEGEMVRALSMVCGPADSLGLRIASRTDKGVNALGNVAVLNSGFEDPHELLRALNAVSDGVFYNGFCEVDEAFNPRHASSRGYRYILDANGLDVDLARGCANLFVGEHDFIRFCRPDGKPTTLTIDSLDVSESDGAIVLTYRAKYFLWNMVRRTAAAIEAVASGRRSISDVEAALDGENINFGVARADALTLTDIQYPGMAFEDHSDPVLKEKSRDGCFSADIVSSFYRSF